MMQYAMGPVVANTGVTCRLKMHSADPIDFKGKNDDLREATI